MSGAGNSAKSAPGRPFQPGQSGNPSGRPKGIASKARELIKDDPSKLLQVFLDIAENPRAKPAERVAAAREYLDRAYGKAPAYAPVEGDPLELDAIDRHISSVLDDLAARRETKAAPPSAAGTLADTGTG